MPLHPRFLDARLKYADFSHADVSRGDFTGAALHRARFHRPTDEDTVWGDRTAALGDDPDLAAAERWQPADRTPRPNREG